MTEVLRLQHDDALGISFVGTDADDYYYDANGPLVVGEIRTPRVSAKDLDILELASHGKIVFTTDATNKALEIGGVGALDPAVIDTTLLDAGAHGLRLASKAGVALAGSSVSLLGEDSLYMTLAPPAVDAATFHHYADPTGLLIGIGVLAPDKSVASGSFFEATADAFTVRGGAGRIVGSGASGRTRYEAAAAHEFFVGAGSSSAADHGGVVEIAADRVTIRGDVDLVGTINSVNETSSTLEVVDRLITLAHSDDPALGGRDALLTGPAGIAIDTVPGSYDDDGAYLSRFLDASGAKLFVDDAARTVDVARARQSGLFAKGVTYDVRSGMRFAGGRDAESRAREPAWEVAGGALHVARFVPVSDGRVDRIAMGFRIRDDGTFEMVRVLDDYRWDAAAETYAPAAGGRRAEVVATFG